MRLEYTEATAESYHDNLFSAASKVADVLDPDAKRETISFEPAVEQAMDEHLRVGNKTAPMAALVKRAIEIEQNDDARDAELLAIARNQMGVETLDERGRDSLDFSDVHVTQIRLALAAAYKAGQEAK